MVHVGIHGLRQPYVRSDGGTEKVQRPEGRDDATVQFPGDAMLASSRVMMDLIFLPSRAGRRPAYL
jgi:hypothetical protein